jgi:murein DD-endopeptidase MepM/ murein hydrolase activator NlpD
MKTQSDSPKPTAPKRAFGKTVFYPVMPRERFYVAAGYLTTRPTYPDDAVGRQQWHTGLDYNLRTGGDSDIGQPVYAIADAEVVSVGSYPGWGGVVVLRHPQFGVRSRYAHIKNAKVKVGEFVKAGQKIAEIAPYRVKNSAHLHFDLFSKTLAPWAWGATNQKFVRETYISPHPWLLEHNALTNTTLKPADD